jgi:GTP-binding protein YchF
MSTNLEVGIVGLPNVGKSTLFNAITKAGAEAANYPFCTIEPNIGVVDVPDVRLDQLALMFKPKKTTPTAIRFVDIAGLVKGASTGEGLGNKFLAHIREVDAIAQVVRCFTDANVTHVEGNLDPLRDIDIINTELCLADLETVEKRLERVSKMLKTGDKKKAQVEMDILTKIKDGLQQAEPARRIGLSDDEYLIIKDINLLTLKPAVFVANLGEDELATPESNLYYLKVKEYATQEQAEVIAVSAKVEAEIAELEEDEAKLFLEELGLTESGLDKLIRVSYSLLGLMHFFTAGEPEVRAWTIHKGTKAPQAAGKIHSDIERGFIRAEIVSFDDLMACGSNQAAKEKGLVRLEGKEYIMQEGDVTYFRFNV